MLKKPWQYLTTETIVTCTNFGKRDVEKKSSPANETFSLAGENHLEMIINTNETA